MTTEQAKGAVKAAASTVARKSRKPRVIADLLIVLSVILTVLSALPYELGEIATTIPPDWKPVIALLGVIATTALGAIRPYLPNPDLSRPPVPRDDSPPQP